MSDQLSEKERVAMMQSADKDGDGVVESHEIPKWKRSIFSIFRGLDGSFSSKRIAAFICFLMGIYSTALAVEFAVIALWVSAGTALLGVSLGERK